MAKRKRKREYTWYVYPIGSHTNEVLASRLPTENFVEGARCADETTRELWICNYAFIRQLRQSAKDLDLCFWVYVREGGGQIRRSMKLQGGVWRHTRATL